MSTYVINRVVSGLVTLIGVVTLIFLLVRIIPGDPAQVMLGDYGTEEQVAAFRHEMGLDQPLPVQYLDFMTDILRGDLGTSMRNRRPILTEISEAVPYTILLTIASMIISVVLGVAAGMISASKRNTPIDHICTTLALVGYSAPAFWLGLLLLFMFSVYLGWFPVIGGGDLGDWGSLARYLVLPSLSLGLRHMGLIARVTRSSLLDVLAEDYVRTARGKGLKESMVIYRHALKNAFIPIVSVIGLDVGMLMGGSVGTEIVFTRPGMGRLLVAAVLSRDYPTVQSLVLVWAAIVIGVNLVVDLAYGALDPRIRYN